jgi:hypothetical protein
MKYSSAAFAAFMGSIVITPAVNVLIEVSSVAPANRQLQEASAAAAAAAAAAVVPITHCAEHLEMYYVANDSVGLPRDVINACVGSKVEKQNGNQLRLPSPRLLQISLPPVDHGSPQLPRFDVLKQAVAAIEENVQRLVEHRNVFVTLDLPSQIDLLFCDTQDSSALCAHSGHFFPPSPILRSIAGVGLRLFRNKAKLGKAVTALDTIHEQKLQLAESMGKMLDALVANYPSTEQDRLASARWIKSYRLVQANMNEVSHLLGFDMVQKALRRKI